MLASRSRAHAAGRAPGTLQLLLASAVKRWREIGALMQLDATTCSAPPPAASERVSCWSLASVTYRGRQSRGHRSVAARFKLVAEPDVSRGGHPHPDQSRRNAPRRAGAPCLPTPQAVDHQPTPTAARGRGVSRDRWTASSRRSPPLDGPQARGSSRGGGDAIHRGPQGRRDTLLRRQRWKRGRCPTLRRGVRRPLHEASPAMAAVALTTDTSMLTAAATTSGSSRSSPGRSRRCAARATCWCSTARAARARTFWPRPVRHASAAAGPSRSWRGRRAVGRSGRRVVVVPDDATGRIQILHLALEHLIVELVEEALLPTA